MIEQDELDQMARTSRHETTALPCRFLGGLEVPVDTEIAPLVQALWTAGLVTGNTCQDSPPGSGRVWIQFLTPEMGAHFADAVAVYEAGTDTLYNRIFARWTPADGTEPPDTWSWSVEIRDAAIKELFDDEGRVTEEHPGKPDADFTLSVRFPRSDLPLVVERMKRHNESAAIPADDSDGPGLPSIHDLRRLLDRLEELQGS